MGNLLSNIIDKLFTKQVKGLMLGLDSAGKTTILYSLKLNEIVQTIPTIGFNVEQVKYRNLDLTLWDIGGQEKIRKLWRHYYDNIDILIYVVDSNDIGRIDESREELQYLVNEDQLKDLKAVLIFCNKMDLPNAAQCSLVAERLQLNKIKQKWDMPQPRGLRVGKSTQSKSIRMKG